MRQEEANERRGTVKRTDSHGGEIPCGEARAVGSCVSLACT